MPLVLESFNEFAARHGSYVNTLSRGMRVDTGSRFVFADGATSDGERRHTEPPEEPVARLRIVRLYWATKLKAETQDFENFRNSVVNQANLARRYANLAMPPEDAADQLKRGQVRIAAIKARLSQIENEITDFDGTKARREQLQRASNERAAQANKIVADIAAMGPNDAPLATRDDASE